MHVIDALNESRRTSQQPCLSGKRVVMVTFSSYPSDPRPRRAADALAQEGMHVEVICLREPRGPKCAIVNSVRVLRLSLEHRRSSFISYAYNYSAFIFISAIVLAARTLTRKYDLVYVHNMPDILVFSSLIPKAFGAKVILDMHDPMPELMMTIFGCHKKSVIVQLLKRLEAWSMGMADAVITVNSACKNLFSSRSCRPEKIGVVMNSPDEDVLAVQKQCPQAAVSLARGLKPYIIMYHGTLVERNGLDLAVEALAHVRAAVPTAELRVYGRYTPFLERVMTMVRNRAMQGCVHFCGPRSQEELAREIGGCDVGIIPNHRNPFTEINTPTRIFEYLALGKPVVVPNTRGITDYFCPGSIILFDAGNAKSLAVELIHTYTHPEEIRDTVQRGREIYLSHSWVRERERLIELVAGLVEPRKQRLRPFEIGRDRS